MLFRYKLTLKNIFYLVYHLKSVIFLLKEVTFRRKVFNLILQMGILNILITKTKSLQQLERCVNPIRNHQQTNVHPLVRIFITWTVKIIHVNFAKSACSILQQNPNFSIRLLYRITLGFSRKMTVFWVHNVIDNINYISVMIGIVAISSRNHSQNKTYLHILSIV